MPEEERNKLPLGSEIHNRLNEARHAARRYGHELGPTRREVSKELSALKHNLGNTLNMDSLPKILQTAVGSREYTSVRRLDVWGLNEYVDENVDCFNRTIFYGVKKDRIQEGQIGVLVVQDIWGATPRSVDSEFATQIKEMDTDGYNESWGTFIPMMLAEGHEFNEEDWTLNDGPKLVIIKNQGGKYFLYGGDDAEYIELMSAGDSAYDRRAVKEILPNEEGELLFGSRGYYWSDEEVELARELYKKYGKFYVLQEASSESEKKEKRAPTNNFVPQRQGSSI